MLTRRGHKNIVEKIISTCTLHCIKTKLILTESIPLSEILIKQEVFGFIQRYIPAIQIDDLFLLLYIIPS